MRHTKAKLEACIHNLNSRGLSLRDLHSSEEIVSSTSTEVSDSSGDPPQGRELLDTCHESDMAFPENINDPAVSDCAVAAVQQEVEQLSTALASKSSSSVPETMKSADPEWLRSSQQQLSLSKSLAQVSDY